MTHPSYTGSQADWSLIPDHMIGGLRRYIENGVEPGGFLKALLGNDLKETFHRADDGNRRRVFEYLSFLYNYAPSDCWGSRDRVNAWMAHRGLDWKEVCRD